MNINLEQIGITQEELRNRVVDKIAEELLTSVSVDDNDNAHYRESEFKRQMDEKVKAGIDSKIQELADKFLIPSVGKQIESLVIEETNRWGEKVPGTTPITFIEYLTQRAEAYLKEPVNYDGKTKSECDSYNWKGSQTRLVYLVNSHLQYSIKVAMDKALDLINKNIASGLEATCKLQLDEISKKLTLSFK